MNNSQESSSYTDFELIALPHMETLRSYAVSLTKDDDDANDLLQETFIRAFRFFDKFEKGTNVKAWLYQIMKNLFYNMYKQKTSGPIKLDYEEVESYFETVKPNYTEDAHLEKELFDNLLNDEIQTAISSLPDDFRTVIILSDLEGLSYEEIAEFVNCPVGTVRSRLHRARKMLSGKLQGYAKSMGYETD